MDGKLVTYTTNQKNGQNWFTEAEILYFQKFTSSGATAIQSTAAVLKQVVAYLNEVSKKINNLPHKLEFLKEPKKKGGGGGRTRTTGRGGRGRGR